MDQSTSSGKGFGTGGIGSWFTLILCTLLFVVNYMDRQVLAVVLQPMKVELGLSDMQAGMLQTVFSLSIAVCAFPIGVLVDRWSRKKTIGLMAIIWSAATFAMTFARNFIGVVIPRAFVGVGEASFSAGSTAIITANFPARMRSRVMGIYNLGTPIGILIGTALGGYLSANFGGWRTPFYYFAIPGVILGIIAFIFLKDYKNLKAAGEAQVAGWQSIGYLFKVPSLLWLFFGAGSLNVLTLSFLAWAPAFMMRAMDIGEDKAGLLMSVVVIATFVGTLLGGFVSDIWYRKDIRSRIHIATLSGPLAIACYIPGILLLGARQLIPALILLFFTCMFAIMYIPAQQVATQEVVHPRTKGMAFGMMLLFSYLIGAPGPAVVGAVSDALGGGTVGLQYALLILPSIMGLLSALFFWLSSRHYASDVAKVKDITLESE